MPDAWPAPGSPPANAALDAAWPAPGDAQVDDGDAVPGSPVANDDGNGDGDGAGDGNAAAPAAANDDNADARAGAARAEGNRHRHPFADLGDEGVIKPVRAGGKGSKLVLPCMLNAYAHRPAILQHLSLFEFFRGFTLVERVKLGGEAARNAVYELSGACPDGLYETHVIRTRSKFYAPKLYPPPPPFPVNHEPDDPSWRRKAHAFAVYALMLHKPWNVQTGLPDALNWAEFVRFTAECYDGGPIIGTLIGRTRYEWIKIISGGVAPSDALKTLCMTWRSVAAKRWDDTTPDPEAMLHRGLSGKPRRAADDDPARRAEDDASRQRAEEFLDKLRATQHESPADAARSAALSSFCAIATGNFRKVTSAAINALPPPPVGPAARGSVLEVPIARIDRKLTRLKNGGDKLPLPSEDKQDERDRADDIKARAQPGGVPAGPAGPEKIDYIKSLHPLQRPLFEMMRACIDEKLAYEEAARAGRPIARPVQRLVFVHAGPGAVRTRTAGDMHAPVRANSCCCILRARRAGQEFRDPRRKPVRGDARAARAHRSPDGCRRESDRRCARRACHCVPRANAPPTQTRHQRYAV